MPVYINSSCVIANNVATKNGVCIFENKDTTVLEFLTSLYKHSEIEYPKFYKMDMLCKLGFLASEILLRESVDLKKYNPFEKGIILSNAQSSLDTDYKYAKTMQTNASPALFVYTLPNILIGEICIRNNIKGESAFFINEQPDTAFMTEYVQTLFNTHKFEACIYGWVDLFEEDYKAVLFYLEKEKSDNSIPFTVENINNIYQIKNG